eukprot:8575560-Alexandrium_andersonii.AAC.1
MRDGALIQLVRHCLNDPSATDRHQTKRRSTMDREPRGLPRPMVEPAVAGAVAECIHPSGYNRLSCRC